MDRAYEGNETRQLALELNFIPVVQPKSDRVDPWEYDHAMYKRRNAIERLFRRLKGFRRIFRGSRNLTSSLSVYPLRPDRRWAPISVNRR
jgi:transposase